MRKIAVVNPWMWKEAWFTNNEKRGTPPFLILNLTTDVKLEMLMRYIKVALLLCAGVIKRKIQNKNC